MRLKFAQLTLIIFIAIFLIVPHALAQRADTMMPEASAAKAKQILSDLVNALGGPGYSEVRESQCNGRRALFGHNGETTGFIDFVNFRRYPDKDRTEYIGKGRNTILLKVCQNEQADAWAQVWDFQLRVCDAVGGAVPLTVVSKEGKR